MRSRSCVFVPADGERKIEKARACGADVLVLDLDEVARGVEPGTVKLALVAMETPRAQFALGHVRAALRTLAAADERPE